VGCCDHGSEEDDKTVGNNVRAWWKRQDKKLKHALIYKRLLKEKRRTKGK
jgi:hypothetical protein